jgi:hypothetical protein
MPSRTSHDCSVVPLEPFQESQHAGLSSICISASDAESEGAARTCKSRSRLLVQSSLDEHDSVPFTYAGTKFPGDAGCADARKKYNRLVGAIIHRTASNASEEDKEWIRTLSSSTSHPEPYQESRNQAEVLNGGQGKNQMREPQGLELFRTSSGTEDESMLEMVSLLGSNRMGQIKKILMPEQLTTSGDSTSFKICEDAETSTLHKDGGFLSPPGIRLGKKLRIMRASSSSLSGTDEAQGLDAWQRTQSLPVKRGI